MKLLIINGPNLNMLGKRNSSLYGEMTMDDLNKNVLKSVGDHITIEFYQSNIEGEIINTIHKAIGNYDGMIINPGAFTHYSYAIRDAIDILNMPVIEVHLSNIHSREEFRKNSVIAPVCCGQITGFKEVSYTSAIYALEKIILEG